MLATFALAALVQVPPSVPRDAEVIYPVMPMVAPSAGSGVSLSQSILSTTVTLTPKEASYETLALYKNTANADGTADLTVAFESWRHGFGEAIKVEALWSDQPVQPVGPVMVLQSVPEKGQLGAYRLKFNLPVKKGATHSLRLKFKLPVGVSGVDREERLVGYKLNDIGPAPLSQFRLAIKYQPVVVFAPIDQQPAWGWEVGADGAYLKLDGKPSNRSAVLAFRYYPPTL
jgi:hypothetical protein